MMETVRARMVGTVEELIASVITWTPKLLIGLLLVALVLIVSKVIERVLRAMLRRLRVDALLERVGIDQALRRVGLVQPVHELLPRITYYLLLFLFVRTGADSLGLTAISSAIGSFMAYLPNLIAAVLILLLGSVAAQIAGRTVTRAATESGIDFAASLGSLVSAVILFVLGIMAIGQLKVDTDVIRLVTACFLAGLGLAFGLSFGLGTRDITRNMIAGFYARKVFRSGEELEIRGERGILKSITPTQTLLERDQRIVAFSNAVFLDEIIKQ